MQFVTSMLIFCFVLTLKLLDVVLYPFYRIGTALSSLWRATKHALHSWLPPLPIPRLTRTRLRYRKPIRSARRTDRRPPQFAYASFFIKLKYFFLGVVFSLLFAFLPLLFLIFLQDLPNPHELGLRHIPQTTKIYDRNGTLLYQIYAQQNRTIVTLDDIPQSLQDATLAIEDKNFYTHPGFDLPAIVRAFLENLSGKRLQGGSTITQQLIKSSLLTPEQRISRKVKEVVLAFWTERIYTKKQILEMYFNQIPYGGTAWGAEAAAEVYFGKPVQELDLAESAFLAGITTAPSTYSPYGPDPMRWKGRQQEVLGRMVALGYISQREAEKAGREQLRFQPVQTSIRAPHFVEYVKNLLVHRYGLPLVEWGGLNVRTSLDLPTQEEAQKIVTE
jgi:membrane peptidoglycan carboxypeptidase